MIYTTEEFYNEIADLLLPLEKLEWGRALGDYVIYYDGKEIGGLYKDRFLVKITPASLRYLAPTAYCIPYVGAKEMLLVESRDAEFLKELLAAVAKEVPARKEYCFDY